MLKAPRLCLDVMDLETCVLVCWQFIIYFSHLICIDSSNDKKNYFWSQYSVSLATVLYLQILQNKFTPFQYFYICCAYIISGKYKVHVIPTDPYSTIMDFTSEDINPTTLCLIFHNSKTTMTKSIWLTSGEYIITF